MKSETLYLTEQEGARIEEKIAKESGEIKKSEICLGVMMAIGALSGMWYAVSLLISLVTTG